MFIKFASIDNFHNLRKGLTKSAYYTPDITIDYRAKVKLHGTNAGVTFAADDRIRAQSRTRIIAPGNDNMGFAAWVEEHMEWFETLRDLPARHGFECPMTIFGEFCGRGIMKQVAISGIDNKIFAIFAIQFGETPSEDDEQSTTSVMVDPDTIGKFLGRAPHDVHILPWYEKAISINFSNVDTMQSAADKLNTLVDEVEACDPWVKKVFGVDGVGEGMVLYPASLAKDGLMLRKDFSLFTFKAKGEKHQVTKTRDAVQLDPDVVASIEAFADMFVTDEGLEQGARAINRGEFEFEHKLIGPFIGWFSKDVHKESESELDVSGLDWRQVNKEITKRAREWYLKKLSEF